ncbi:MAG: hypothetical protein HND48_19405 [Chloroflexi bacterium]|nr:hypothetical protein [Chloroflexota bacterium]
MSFHQTPSSTTSRRRRIRMTPGVVFALAAALLAVAVATMAVMRQTAWLL